MPPSRFLVDIGPLKRSVQFRRLYFSYTTSLLGIQLATIAVPYEMYRVTGSTLQVGAISMVQFVTLFIGAIGGGALADHMDRRSLLIGVQLAKVVVCALLAINAVGPHPNIALIYLLAAFISGLTGIENPTRAAFFVTTVAQDDIVAANTLWQVLYQLAQIVGPLLGGLMIASINVAAVYWIAAGATVVCSFNLLAVAKSPKAPSTGKKKAGVFEGIRYLRGKPVLQSVFLVDLNAMIFGMPAALFPALAIHHFHGGAGTFGLLTAGPAMGALVVAMFMGWATNIHRQGLAVLFSVALWGAGVVGFGLTSSLAIGLICLAIAGGADVISAVFRTSILQIETPDDLRGRLQGVQFAVVAGGPRLGNFEAGAVASASGSLEFSVISGGLICILGVIVLAAALPSFAKYAKRTTSIDDEVHDEDRDEKGAS